MLLCPRCTVELVGERRHDGNVFVCPTCGGEAATIAVLRKRLTTDAVNELWRRARTATRRGERPCPACHDAMVEVGVHAGAREAVVDACARCQMAWFDAGELEVVPAKPPPPAPAKLSPEAAEAWAKLVTRPPDDTTFERVEPGTSDFYAGLAGAPTKVGAPERDGRPWVTWALAAAILALTVIPIFRDGFAAAFSRKHDPLLDLARAWGFVPADAWRHGGLTLVTCFFLHGGWLHALWNTYFLVLTGEDLEGVLGRGRLLLFLLAATVGGSAVHAAMNPGSDIPCVGASGGIAGMFAYYALALPKVRLGIAFGSLYSMAAWGLVRVKIPVRLVFGIWFALEIIYSTNDRDGIAHGAHVGGALAGVAWWAVERFRRRDGAAER